MNSVPTMVTGFRDTSRVLCKTGSIGVGLFVLHNNASIIDKARNHSRDAVHPRPGVGWASCPLLHIFSQHLPALDYG